MLLYIAIHSLTKLILSIYFLPSCRTKKQRTSIRSNNHTRFPFLTLKTECVQVAARTGQPHKHYPWLQSLLVILNTPQKRKISLEKIKKNLFWDKSSSNCVTDLNAISWSTWVSSLTLRSHWSLFQNKGKHYVKKKKTFIYSFKYLHNSTYIQYDCSAIKYTDR